MKRTLAVLALAAGGILAIGLPAQATPNATCPKAAVTFTQTGIATFPSSTSQPGCTVQLSSWAVPDTYDGKGNDASAQPQTLFDRTVATLATDTQTVQVKVPPTRCRQIDYRAAGGTYLYGRITCTPTPTPTPTTWTATGGTPLLCKPHQHAVHGKCVADAPKPTGSRTTTARVRLAELPRTGGFDHPVLWTGVLLLVVGIVLASIRRSDRRH